MTLQMAFYGITLQFQRRKTEDKIMTDDVRGLRLVYVSQYEHLLTLPNMSKHSILLIVDNGKSPQGWQKLTNHFTKRGNCDLILISTFLLLTNLLQKVVLSTPPHGRHSCCMVPINILNQRLQNYILYYNLYLNSVACFTNRDHIEGCRL